MLTALKARFPRFYPFLAIAIAASALGGAVAYERSAQAADCCVPGAACCYPGAPCCTAHRGAHPKS